MIRNRFIKHALPILGAVMMALIPALPVLADSYDYSLSITVAESDGTARTNLKVLTGIPASNLSSVGVMAASGLDTRVKEGTTEHGYGLNTTQVPIFIPALGANQTRVYDLYTGYDPVQTNLSIMTGEGGYVTTLDNAALEPASDFVITQAGYYASDRIGAFIYKANAFATYSNGAGSMKSSVLGASSGLSPTGDSDPDSAWSTEANAYDGNTATSAITTANVATNTWSSYLYITRAASDITAIRIYAALGTFTLADIDIYDGTWHNSTSAIYNNAAWTQFDLPYHMAGNITQMRIRFYNGGAPAQATLYEVQWFIPTLAASAVASGYSSGIHTIQTTGVAAGNLTITVDTVDQDTDPIAAVPGNANDWISIGDAWGYLNSMTMNISAVDQLHYHPATMLISTTVVDETNAYDGTITWGSNPSGVSVTLGALESYAATAHASGSDAAADTIFDATEPTDWTAVGAADPGLFFYGSFNDAATDLGISTQTLYVIVILGISAAIGASIFIFTGSLIFATAGVGVVMIAGVSAGILSVWMLFGFVILAIGIIYVARQV